MARLTLLGSGSVGAVGGGGGTTINSPLDLTGLLGWWDAKVTASLSLTGADINSVADQSGAGRTMNWAGYAKPKYNATGFNSQPAIEINAASFGNALEATSFPMGTGNTLTFFWVGRPIDAQMGLDNPRALSYIGAGQTNDYANPNSWACARMKQFGATKFSIVRDSVAVTRVDCTATDNVNHRFIGTIDSTGTQTLYIDNVANTLATAPGNWTSPGTLSIGRYAPANSYWGGPFGELGVASGYHNATQCGQLDTYLKTKWGL